MGRYFTRASKLTGLAEIAPDRADLEARMRNAGIDPEALRRSEMAIDYGGFCDLLQDCAAAWAMPDLGLRMARHQGVEVLGPVALIIRMERSVRAALTAIAANLVIHSNAIVAALEEEEGGDTASLIVELRGDAPTCRENTELIMAQAKLILVEEARTEVARQMELGTCTLENVARGLRMSPRSLQRQLRDEGTTFGDLVDGWRRDRALALVTHTRLPLSEVSDALGYSEQSVFTKAFRRWYGGTPLRCRAEGAPPVAVQ